MLLQAGGPHTALAAQQKLDPDLHVVHVEMPTHPAHNKAPDTQVKDAIGSCIARGSNGDSTSDADQKAQHISSSHDEGGIEMQPVKDSNRSAPRQQSSSQSAPDASLADASLAKQTDNLGQQSNSALAAYKAVIVFVSKVFESIGPSLKKDDALSLIAIMRPAVQLAGAGGNGVPSDILALLLLNDSPLLRLRCEHHLCACISMRASRLHIHLPCFPRARP
jgi:hypothetical protein